MTDATEKWTTEQAREYFRTGRKPSDGPPPKPIDLTQPSKTDVRNEKDLQTQCQNELELRGYAYLSADRAETYYSNGVWPPRGWWGHLHNPRRNPLMPDLFIMSHGRCLLVELKVCSVYQQGQREMIQMGEWNEVRTFARFVELLDKLEKHESKA